MIANKAEYRIVLPRFTNADPSRGIPAKRIPEEHYYPFLQALTGRFGGITIYRDTVGCWDDDKRGVVCEPNMVVSAFRIDGNVSPRSDVKAIENIARHSGNVFGQAAILSAKDCNANLTFCEWRPTLQVSSSGYLRNKDAIALGQQLRVPF